jgi:hypothetical protein
MSMTMVARTGIFLVAATSAAAGVGCGDAHCGGKAGSNGDRAPVIEKFFVLDQQVPGDPWTVLYGVDFTAPEGTLGNGQAEFFLNNDNTPTTQELADAFRQSGVALTETTGSLWMALRFASDVKDGTKVRLGLQLVDPAGDRSNCYTLDLEFSVSPVATLGPALPPKATVGKCAAALRKKRHA